METEMRNGKRKIVLGMVGGIVIAAALFFAIRNLLWKDMLPVSTNGEGVGLTIEDNIQEWVEPTLAPQDPGVAIAGMTAMKLPAGETEAKVTLRNPVENEGWYYLTYQLYLIQDKVPRSENAEDGYELITEEEPLFETGLIPAGMCCDKVKLRKELEEGEYDAVLHIQPYRMNEARTPTNNLDIEITLIVEEKKTK